MLEPRNRSKRSRRRQFVAQEQQQRSQQPIPLRRPNPWSNPGSASDLEGRMRQSDRHQPQSDRPGSQIQPAQPPRRSRAEATNRNASFNLRNLLSNEPTSTTQFRKGGTTRSPNSGIQSVPDFRRNASAPIQPIARPTQPVTRLKSYPVASSEPSRTRNGRGKVNGLPSTAQAAPPQRRRQIQSRPHKPSPLTYAVRLLIFGVGVGAIAGTILSLFSPAIQPSNGVSQAATNTIGIHSSNAQSGSSQSGSHPHLTPFMQLGQELTDLKRSLQNLTAQYPDLTPGIFLVDLDSNAYIDLNAAASFPAASTIKVPILVALLQDVDAGKIQLDQLLTMESEDVTDGSGDMQYQAVGTQYTVLETADMMITISDNTATNMLIRRLGGAQLLNQRFQSWGLENTVIRSPLADLGGTNTTSPKDLSELLVKVSQGDLLSLRSRDRLLKIMQSTVTNTLIPEGVADNQAVVAHKTGTIDSMVGDTGIVDMPTGKRFVITVLMQRSSDDGRAQELIRQICREVYDYLKQPTASRSTLTPSSTDSFNSPVIEQPTIP